MLLPADVYHDFFPNSYKVTLCRSKWSPWYLQPKKYQSEFIRRPCDTLNALGALYFYLIPMGITPLVVGIFMAWFRDVLYFGSKWIRHTIFWHFPLSFLTCLSSSFFPPVRSVLCLCLYYIFFLKIICKLNASSSSISFFCPFAQFIFFLWC